VPCPPSTLSVSTVETTVRPNSKSAIHEFGESADCSLPHFILAGPEGNARAFFSAPPPTVVFCANRLHSAREVEETMVHELIHAYDVR
jgi:hypothetical protein